MSPLLTHPVLVSATFLLLQALGQAVEAPKNPPAAVPAAPAAGVRSDFQPYIFWAYGCACLLLLLFNLWTVIEAAKVGKKVDYLHERFRASHPGVLEEDNAPAQGSKLN